MIAAADRIDAAMHLSSNGQWLRRKVKDAPSFIVANFRDGDLPAICCHHSEIVHLTAACGIKSCAVKHDDRPALALKSFDHARVEVVEKRIVIVEAVSHWGAISGQHLELSIALRIILKQQSLARAPFTWCNY